MRLYRFYLPDHFYILDKFDQINELTDYFSLNLERLQSSFEAIKYIAFKNIISYEMNDFIKRSHIFCFRELLNLQKECFDKVKKNKLPRIDYEIPSKQKNDEIREEFVIYVNQIIMDIEERINDASIHSTGDDKIIKL